jgi:hypothetical protein
MNFSAFVFITAATLLATPVFADKIPLPKAAYSADVTIVSKGSTYTGHVNVDGAKELRAIKDKSGVETVRIIRRDQGKVYDLRPKRHLAVAMRLAAAEAAGETGAAPGTDVDSFYGAEAIPEGQETIAGLETTKYHIKMDAGPGLTVDAEVWATEDGIIARVIGKTSVDSDNQPARMELTNVVRGPQDAALFELPAAMELLSTDSDSDVPQNTVVKPAQ